MTGVRSVVLPAVMAVLGVAIVVRTILEGGGALAVGVVVGCLFVAAGVLRLAAERRRR